MDKAQAKKLIKQKNKLMTPSMSLEAKQRVYKDYKGGMSVRDISLKFGILPERVCAIVWNMEYFLKIVYPRIGETMTRELIREEYEMNKDSGFCDYGLDLEALAQNEQGIPAINFGRRAIDKYQPQAEKKLIEEKLGRMKAKHIFEVPLKQIGKGPNGYLLKEVIHNTGKSSVRPDRRVTEGVRKANVIRPRGYE